MQKQPVICFCCKQNSPLSKHQKANQGYFKQFPTIIPDLCSVLNYPKIPYLHWVTGCNKGVKPIPPGDVANKKNHKLYGILLIRLIILEHTPLSLIHYFIQYTSFMNKGELVEKLAADAGISKKQAGAALDSFTEAVAKTLKKGDKVTLVGFGTFSVSKRAARTGRNPQTGEKIKIKAKKVARFKAGKELSGKI